MIKKTITYTDYNGVEKSEPHYFNLNQIELIKLESAASGGLEESMKRLIETKDILAIIDVIEDLIQKSYGVKTADGRFVKRKEDLDAFMSSPAYEELFMSLASNADAAAEFFNGVIPSNLAEKIKAHTGN